MIDKVIVGKRTYPVVIKELNEGKDLFKDEMIFGLHIDYLNEIQIDDKLSDEQKKLTFVHELLHAIFSNSGAYAIVEDEEAIVSVLTNTMFQTLQDNDFSWLRDEEEHEEIITKDGHMKLTMDMLSDELQEKFKPQSNRQDRWSLD